LELLNGCDGCLTNQEKRRILLEKSVRPCTSKHPFEKKEGHKQAGNLVFFILRINPKFYELLPIFILV